MNTTLLRTKLTEAIAIIDACDEAVPLVPVEPPATEVEPIPPTQPSNRVRKRPAPAEVEAATLAVIQAAHPTSVSLTEVTSMMPTASVAQVQRALARLRLRGAIAMAGARKHARYTVADKDARTQALDSAATEVFGTPA